jgi:hypothetical protein
MIIRNIIREFNFLGNKVAQLFRGYFLFRSIKNQKQFDEQVTIVFHPAQIMPIYRDIELFFGYQLAIKGAKVKIIFDDGHLKHWDSAQIHDRNKPLSLYKQKFLFNLKIDKKVSELIYHHKNIERIYYSSIFKKINPDEINLDNDDKYQAVNSVNRFFEEGIFDPGKKEQKKFYDLSIQNCKMSKSVGKYIVKELRPDIFISSHGTYSTWGPCYNYVKRHNTPSVIYDTHIYRKQKMFITDAIHQLMYKDSDWNSFKNNRITQDGKLLVDQYFHRRISHTTFDTSIYYNHTGSLNDDLQLNDGETDSMVFGMFPGVVWDGDIVERNSIFNGLIEWIEYTIKVLAGTNHHLLIRFHPSEATMFKGTIKLMDVLLKRDPEIMDYPNITLIPSDESIDSYALIRNHLDIGLIYSGILALEMTYLNIPVISCSHTFYSETGIVYEPDNKNQYKTMLLNAHKLKEDFNNNIEFIRDNLYRYAYWYFIKSAYDVPLLNPQKVFRVDYRQLTKNDIDPTKNKALERTIEKLLSYGNRI